MWQCPLAGTESSQEESAVSPLVLLMGEGVISVSKAVGATLGCPGLKDRHFIRLLKTELVLW